MMTCIYCWNWNTIWTFIAAMATISLAIIAWVQLKKFRDVSTAQFIQNFKNDFFTPKAMSLFMLLEFEQIKFCEENKEGDKIPNLPDDFSHFKVTLPNFQRSAGETPDYLGELKNVYSCYEIDDCILGNFEELGLLEEQETVSLKSINEVFGVYLDVVGKNNEIKIYIKYLRDEYKDVTIYERFDTLVSKINKLNRKND
jgi:hypothetical protein